MAKLCEYRNCHNLGDRSWGGYCNQYHFERAMDLQLKEAKERAKAKVEAETVAVTLVAGAGQGNHTSCGEAKQSGE